MRNNILAICLFLLCSATAIAKPAPELYTIQVYQLKNVQQEERVEKYLKAALVPALHRMGIAEVGIFKPVGNDTAAVRKIYVLIPFRNSSQWATWNLALEKDVQYLSDGKDYLQATFDDPPYLRIESILLRAFPEMPRHAAPKALTGPTGDKIYELRSYESPTESYFINKVKMFNQGGEISLFQRLGFNAVFYASVLDGAHMPNLMYMTSFANMASRDEHWKNFGTDPFWKNLSSLPEYQHNVFHIDILFLHPTDYSDL